MRAHSPPTRSVFFCLRMLFYCRAATRSNPVLLVAILVVVDGFVDVLCSPLLRRFSSVVFPLLSPSALHARTKTKGSAVLLHPFSCLRSSPDYAHLTFSSFSTLAGLFGSFRSFPAPHKLSPQLLPFTPFPISFPIFRTHEFPSDRKSHLSRTVASVVAAAAEKVRDRRRS